MQDVDAIVAEAASQFAAIDDLPRLENAKARYLGKQGVLTDLLKGLGKLAPEEKRDRGSRINAAKDEIERLLEVRRAGIASARLDARLAEEALDVTLPGRSRGRGSIHPIVRTWQRVEAIFRSVGFDVADGPEIENDWYNFTALNNPENHPARSMQDTFYVDEKDAGGLPLLLRTHTSPMQVRYARVWVQRFGQAAEVPPSRSSRPAAPTGWTVTPPTRRCFIRSRASGSARTSASPT